jgi:hypothetical protein
VRRHPGRAHHCAARRQAHRHGRQRRHLGRPPQIHLNDLVFSEAYLTGIIGYLGDHPATIGLLADDLIDVGFFITKRIKLDKPMAASTS